MKYMYACLFCCIAVLAEGNVFADYVGDNPVEIGSVTWGMDLAEAQSLSQSSGKPIFLLFQEVPGCTGCKDFGRDVLSFPLLVEAIENEFHAVVIYNNRLAGRDAAIRQKYNEPSWNYQVIRFLDARGDDIIPRRDGIWTISGVAMRMVECLQRSNRPIPRYLRTIVLENDLSRHRTVAFAMACFWTGEYYLGKIDGVIATEAGWYDNREVTLVTYHHGIVDLEKLTDAAARVKCAQKVYITAEKKINRTRFDVGKLQLSKYRKASASDQKKQLQRWKKIGAVDGLSDMQLTKLNAWLPDNLKQAKGWLSPRQLEQFEKP